LKTHSYLFYVLGKKKGVLLEGPPGVGKTLLAKAVAGEAKVPFLAVSGSEFIELYVGQGAQRVRQLFAKARWNAPCIIFIDEIDSIGVRGKSCSNTEQVQTLNQILTEMDGFEANEGVVVIAATNFAHQLDPAMKRPGRFDRHIKMELPSKAGREEILLVHAKNKPLDHDVNLTSIAASTIGMSGAELANVLNEAAMTSARHSRSNITHYDIDEAMDRVTIGVQKKSNLWSGNKKEVVSVHEAGHAVAMAFTQHYSQQVRKVTIVPRSGGVGGFTSSTPKDDGHSSLKTREELESELIVSFGGRVAEEIMFGQGKITSGASGDLEHISGLAKAMVEDLGFTSGNSGRKGFGLSWAPVRNSKYDLYGLHVDKSEHTQKMIDEEIEKIVSEAYLKCKELLLKHLTFLKEVSETLKLEETIGEEKFTQMLESYKKQIKGSKMW
jgi:cell division protease FtsH